MLSFSYTIETTEGQHNLGKLLNFSQSKHSLAICLVFLQLQYKTSVQTIDLN